MREKEKIKSKRVSTLFWLLVLTLSSSILFCKASKSSQKRLKLSKRVVKDR